MSQLHLDNANVSLPLPPKPFLKWAGGKRQLLQILNKNMPLTFGTFFEPFLGGGALFFNMLSKRIEQKYDVSDLNSDLILSYVTIRDSVDDLICSLQNHEKRYKNDPKSYYYFTRESSPDDAVEKTSRLIFLNRTCFNGLYRVNSKGKFNVPLGSYTNPKIVNEANLRAVSANLKSNNVSITCRDFKDVLQHTKKGDFVYFDPPYQPVSDTSNFTSYTNKNFVRSDLDRLADICKKLDSKGRHVLLSNSNSTVVRDMFPDKPWTVLTVNANRSINSNSKRRTNHSEILIKNY